MEYSYRMYSFVLRQINAIQKGIQTTHGVVEYSNMFSGSTEYKIWSRGDKTLIILDGGTSKDLININEMLCFEGIKHSIFTEEDLGDLITSVCVLADERVWDLKKYPPYDPNPSPAIRFDSSGNPIIDLIKIEPEPYEKWVERMGGEENVKLRELIFSKKLAQ